PIVTVSTAEPVNLPYINFILEFAWPKGQMIRQFTAVLDEPLFLGSKGKESRRAVSGAQSGTTNGAVTSSGSEIEYGPVQWGEMLWNVAEKVKPDKVTVEQMMLALLNQNREAFFGSNVNMLRSGAVLRIHDMTGIAEISQRDAKREISTQYKQWLDYKQKRQLERQGRVSNEGLSTGAVGDSSRASGPIDTSSRLQLEDVQSAESGKSASEANAEIENLQQQLRAEKWKNALLQKKLQESGQTVDADSEVVTVENEDLAAIQEGAAEAPEEDFTNILRDPITISFVAALFILLGVVAWGMTRSKKKPKQKDNIFAPPYSASPVEELQKEEDLADDFAESGIISKVRTRPASEVKSEGPISELEQNDQDEFPSSMQLQSEMADVHVESPRPMETELDEPVDEDTVALSELSAVAAVDDVDSTGLAVSSEESEAESDSDAELSELIGRLEADSTNSEAADTQQVSESEEQASSVPKTSLSEIDLDSLEPEEMQQQPIEESLQLDLSTLDSENGDSDVDTVHIGDLDAIAEADIYLTYDKYEQAEAFLKEAIDRNPERQELKLKLLEAYYLQQKVEAFEEQAENLYAAIGGNEMDALWLKAREMGREIDPVNPLFQSESNFEMSQDQVENANDDDSEISTYIGPEIETPTSMQAYQDESSLQVTEIVDSQALEDPVGDEFERAKQEVAAEKTQSVEEESSINIQTGPASVQFPEITSSTQVEEVGEAAATELNTTQLIDDLSGLDSAISEIESNQQTLSDISIESEQEPAIPTDIESLSDETDSGPVIGNEEDLVLDDLEKNDDPLSKGVLEGITTGLEEQAMSNLELPESEPDSEVSDSDLVISGLSDDADDFKGVPLDENQLSISQISASDDSDLGLGENDKLDQYVDAVSDLETASAVDAGPEDTSPVSMLNSDSTASKIQDMGFAEAVPHEGSNLALASVLEVPTSQAPQDLSSDASGGVSQFEGLEDEIGAQRDILDASTVEAVDDSLQLSEIEQESDPDDEIVLERDEPNIKGELSDAPVAGLEKSDQASLDTSMDMAVDAEEEKLREDEQEALSALVETISRQSSVVDDVDEQGSAQVSQQVDLSELESNVVSSEAAIDQDDTDALLASLEDEYDGADEEEALSSLEDSSYFLLNDEMGTKLDLARAYIEMGDKKHAQKILDEVKIHGDDTQRKEAEELLASSVD
ncbi:MAG: hypothetical protein OEZ47_11810, partial [Gammaproteobacteria bacterium]|nr:hypothetical protein [Gammaproteobacteria bacterium]